MSVGVCMRLTNFDYVQCGRQLLMAIEERHARRRNKLRAGDVYKTHQQSRSFLKFDAQKLKVQRVQRITSRGHAILGTYLGTERKSKRRKGERKKRMPQVTGLQRRERL